MRQTTATICLCLTLSCAALAAAAPASDEATAGANPLFPPAVAQQRLELLDRLASLQRNEEGLADPERLARFIDLSFEHALLTSPEFATSIGHPTGHDRWSDNSLAARERDDADARQALDFLRSLDRGKLSGVDRLNYDLLRQDFEETVEGQRFPGEYLAISQMGGIHQYLPPTLMRNPARTVADYEAILARLRAVPALVDNVIERLQKGLAAGVTPARVTLAGVPEQLAALEVDDPLTSPFLEPFTRIPQNLPAADRERLTREAAETFRAQIAPAFARLRSYVIDTYTPGARDAAEVGDGGADAARGRAGHHLQIALAQELEELPDFRSIRATRPSSKAGASTPNARRGDGVLPGPVLEVRPAHLRDVARRPAGGRHRHARARLDAPAGDRLLRRQRRQDASTTSRRDRPLHRLARPGAGLQDRRAEDQGAARDPRVPDGALPLAVLESWATASTSARSTTRCSARAPCLTRTGGKARYVMSLCDGAFLLAKAGLLQGRLATTFPADQDAFARMFPKQELRRDVSFVHDGPAITSVGGARSYDAALYLVDHLFGEEVARKVADGLVIPWPPGTPQELPALVVRYRQQ
jgi:hypothetical protein